MKRHKVIVDPAERQADIKAQIADLATEAGGLVLDMPELLAEVTNLVEKLPPPCSVLLTNAF